MWRFLKKSRQCRPRVTVCDVDQNEAKKTSRFSRRRFKKDFVKEFDIFVLCV